MPTQKKKQSKAILSPTLEEKLGSYLIIIEEKYYIIYRLGIETGMPQNQILQLTVSDLRDKNAVFYSSKLPASTPHTDGIRVPLSQKLKDEIASFLGNRAGKEYAFCAQDGVTPLSVSSMRTALLSATEKCGVADITCISPRKTYFYHLFLKTNDINKIRKMLCLSSVKKVYEYLGLDDLHYENEYRPAHRTALFHSDLVEEVAKNTNTMFDYIRTTCNVPSATNEFCMATVEFLNNISAATNIYASKASVPSIKNPDKLQ